MIAAGSMPAPLLPRRRRRLGSGMRRARLRDPARRRRRPLRRTQIWVDCGKIMQDLLKNQQTKIYFGEPVKVRPARCAGRAVVRPAP